MTEFRFLEGVKGQGKVDAFMVDWHVIQPDPDNDLRDLTTPENRAHIERLKDSIAVVGVKEALLVRKDEADNIFAIDGKCRLTALAELEAEGRPFPPKVKTLPEERGTDRKKRMLNMLTVGRDRKNLSDFEFAQGLYRSIELGYTEKEVCAELGWKSLATLHNHLDSLTMKPKLREMVEQGKISRTEALRLSKMTDADPGEIMKAAEEEHKRLNKKGAPKIKPRHVRAATKKTEPPKPDPKPAPFVAEDETAATQGKTADANEAKSVTFTVPTNPLDATMPGEVATSAEPATAHEPHPQLQTAAEREQPRSMSTVLKEVETIIAPARAFPPEAMHPPTAARDIDRAMFAIIGELAAIGEPLILNEFADTDKIEVTADIIKRADRIYRQRIGDTSEAA